MGRVLSKERDRRAGWVSSYKKVLISELIISITPKNTREDQVCHENESLCLEYRFNLDIADGNLITDAKYIFRPFVWARRTSASRIKLDPWQLPDNQLRGSICLLLQFTITSAVKY